MRITKEIVPFAQVANEVLQDKEISLKAKGLYAYLFSKPESWDFSGDRIVNEMSDGRKAVYAALKELETKGYLERRRHQTGRMEYVLKYSTRVPTIGEGSVEPLALFGKEPKPHLAKKGSISNKENISNKDNSTAPSAGKLGNELIDLFQHLNPSYKRLFMRKPQHESAERLVALHGFDKLQRIVAFIQVRRIDRYCPTITTPVQLEERWAALEVYAAKLKDQKKPVKIV